MEMKSTKFLLFSLFLSLCSCHKMVDQVFEKDGDIFIQFEDGSAQLAKLRNTDGNSVTWGRLGNEPITLSSDKSFLIYKGLSEKILFAEEGSEFRDQYIVCKYDIKKEKSKTLFMTSFNRVDGTKVTNAEIKQLPYNVIIGIYNEMLSPDNERLYFNSEELGVSYAVHYYDFKADKVFFFGAGDLIGVTTAGILINTTGIDNGRYWQKKLFDKDGNVVKEYEKEH